MTLHAKYALNMTVISPASSLGTARMATSPQGAEGLHSGEEDGREEPFHEKERDKKGEEVSGELKREYAFI